MEKGIRGDRAKGEEKGQGWIKGGTRCSGSQSLWIKNPEERTQMTSYTKNALKHSPRKTLTGISEFHSHKREQYRLDAPTAPSKVFQGSVRDEVRNVS